MCCVCVFYNQNNGTHCDFRSKNNVPFVLVYFNEKENVYKEKSKITTKCSSFYLARLYVERTRKANHLSTKPKPSDGLSWTELSSLSSGLTSNKSNRTPSRGSIAQRDYRFQSYKSPERVTLTESGSIASTENTNGVTNRQATNKTELIKSNGNKWSTVSEELLNNRLFVSIFRKKQANNIVVDWGQIGDAITSAVNALIVCLVQHTHTQPGNYRHCPLRLCIGYGHLHCLK